MSPQATRASAKLEREGSAACCPRSPVPRKRFIGIDARLTMRDASPAVRDSCPGWLEAVAAPRRIPLAVVVPLPFGHRKPSRSTESLAAARCSYSHVQRQARTRSCARTEFCSAQAAQPAPSTSLIQRQGNASASGCNRVAGFALGNEQAVSLQFGPAFCPAVDALTASVDANVQWYESRWLFVTTWRGWCDCFALLLLSTLALSAPVDAA
jgi:hypothetical protein